MGRILCLDVGDARIGVAVSDETRLISTPYSVIRHVGWGPDVRQVLDAFQKTGADYVLCGLPRNMDGTEGFQAQKVRAFAAQLEKAGMPVQFEDERLSTVSATDALIEGGVRREDRRQYVDKVAAAVILQQHLDGLRQGSTRTGAGEE